MQNFRNAGKRIGLEINESKTKVMKVSRGGRVVGQVEAGGCMLEVQ